MSDMIFDFEYSTRYRDKWIQLTKYDYEIVKEIIENNSENFCDYKVAFCVNFSVYLNDIQLPVWDVIPRLDDSFIICDDDLFLEIIENLTIFKNNINRIYQRDYQEEIKIKSSTKVQKEIDRQGYKNVLKEIIESNISTDCKIYLLDLVKSGLQ